MITQIIRHRVLPAFLEVESEARVSLPLLQLSALGPVWGLLS